MVYSPKKYRETEGVKVRRLGYDLSDARLKATALSLGIDKATSSMTQAEKAQLRYYAIMTQVTSAQGDMARTLTAPANQLRILQAQVTQAGRAIGSIFIPMLNAILPPAIAVMQVIRGVATAIASLFGFSMPEVEYSAGLDSISAGANNAAESLGGAAGAAKELQKYVMGFDELNIIPEQSSGGGGGGGGAGGGSLSGFDFELPEYDFLANAVASNVDKIYRKIKPFGDWVIDNLETIISLGKAAGGAFLAWSVAKSFIPNLEAGWKWLSKIKGLAGTVAAIAITSVISYNLSNEFVGEDGKAADLIGSGLSAAFGSAIAAKSFTTMFGKGAGTYGASLALIVSAGATIMAGIDEIDGGEINKRTLLNGLLGVFEAGAAGALTGFKVGGVKGAAAGAAISAAIAIGVQASAIIEGINGSDIKESLNWGDVQYTKEEMRAQAERMFVLDVIAHMDVTDSLIDDEEAARNNLNETILTFQATLNPIKLGLDTSETALNALASEADNLISQLQTLLSAQQKTITYAMSLVPADGEGNTDVNGILAATGLANNTLTAAVTEIGGKLSQALSDGMVDGLSAEEQRLITEYSATLARISEAVARGKATSEFGAKTGSLLTDLNMDSFEGVLAEYKALETELEGSFRDLAIQTKADMGGQIAGLQAYLDSLDAAKDPERYKEVKGQLETLMQEYADFDVAEWVSDAMSGAVGSAHEEWQTALSKIFGSSVNVEDASGYMSAFFGNMKLGSDAERNIKQIALDFENKLNTFLYDTLSADEYKVFMEASETIGFTDWDVLGADIQTQFYNSMVDAIGAEATQSVFEQLGYSIPGLIEAGMNEGGDLEITPTVNATQAETDLANVQSEIAATGTAADSMSTAVSEATSGVSTAFSDASSEVTSAWSNVPNWFGTNVVNPISESFDGIDWKKSGVEAATKFKNGLKGVSMPKFRISWESSTKEFQFNGTTQVMKVPLPVLKFYAQGGFPKTGEMFVANEAGPELVGRIGNRTAVANEEQVGEAIFRYMDEHDREKEGMSAEGLAAAMVSAMRAAGLGSVNIDGREIVRSINRYTQHSGKPAVT